MKKMLLFSAMTGLVATSSTTVAACNTIRANREYSGVFTLQDLWSLSNINTISLNLLDLNDENADIQTEIQNLLINLIESRIDINELWKTDKTQFIFGFEYRNNEINLNESLRLLVEKHNSENDGFFDIPLTFNVSLNQQVSAHLPFNLTNRETINFTIDDNNIVILNSINNFKELNPVEEGERQELWIDSTLISPEMTAINFNNAVYETMIRKLDLNNYNIFINWIYSQISATEVILRWNAMNIIQSFNYILNPVSPNNVEVVYDDPNNLSGESGTTFEFNFFGTDLIIRSFESISIL